MITLVLGGARSGKSAVAERLAARTDEPVTYLATGVASDEDMAGRIAAHRARRPPQWRTIETDRRLVDVLAATEGTVLVDGVGTWVALSPEFQVDTEGLCRVLKLRRGDTVLVSDEVGLGVHPSSEVGRHFRDALGSVNQALAAAADRVLLVVAGRVLPLEPLE